MTCFDFLPRAGFVRRCFCLTDGATTDFHIAATGQEGHLDIVRHMLDQSANVRVDAADNTGLTPLFNRPSTVSWSVRDF